MAYFLKKTKNHKGLYLQIYESFYDPVRKQTAHRSIKPLGYVHELAEAGIKDPLSYYADQVKEMNAERKKDKDAQKIKRIQHDTPERDIGYFPLKAINEGLGVRADMDTLNLAAGFRFSLFELVSSLVYARTVHPASKSKTYFEVIPKLLEPMSFSLDQLFDGLAFLGREYQKVVEIYNAHIASLWKRDTTHTYFDCTNFFFEIDKEDAFRRRGPSKERRTDPIVGLGLLLDADCIPVGLECFAGNESEKPQMEKVVSRLKRRYHMQGRTVRVADKGLNCADNIADAILSGDGYLFSKSVKQLPKEEQAWACDPQGWVDVADDEGNVCCRLKSVIGEFSYQVSARDGKAKKRTVALLEKRVATFSPALAKKQLREIERQVEKARRLRLGGAKRKEFGDSAKFVTFTAIDKNGCIEEEDSVAVALNHEAIAKARSLAGYNMLVTSEVSMDDKEVYQVYHRLWRIEESFRVMKTELDARPVYLQRPDAIIGHFLICYLSVTLLRLLQFKVLDNRFGSAEIMEFIRAFKVVKCSERKYINISASSRLGDELERITHLPLNYYYLTSAQVKDIVSCRFDLRTSS